jgi:hypothetical protein
VEAAAHSNELAQRLDTARDSEGYARRAA